MRRQGLFGIEALIACFRTFLPSPAANMPPKKKPQKAEAGDWLEYGVSLRVLSIRVPCHVGT